MEAEANPLPKERTRERAGVVLVQGIRISAMDREQALARLADHVGNRARAHSVYLVNAHTINLAQRDPGYSAVLNRGDLVLGDGIGVALAARMKGTVLRHNFCGTDFVPEFLDHCAQGKAGGIRVFLLGGVPGRARDAGMVLQRRVPGVQVAGFDHGYRSDHQAVVRRIRDSRPDVLLVAMGNPLQESWIDRFKGDLDVPLSLGVGALFDFLTGAVPRAPVALRRMGMEWAYRLAVEPRRMASRYVIGNPLFLARAMSDAFRS
jgi:exopolysaccharide biosynthesis WecB/TagA/CpsF family protein